MMELKLRDINKDSNEGRLLLAALAMLSVINKWSPQESLEKVHKVCLKTEKRMAKKQ